MLWKLDFDEIVFMEPLGRIEGDIPDLTSIKETLKKGKKGINEIIEHGDFILTTRLIDYYLKECKK